MRILAFGSGDGRIGLTVLHPRKQEHQRFRPNWLRRNSPRPGCHHHATPWDSPLRRRKRTSSQAAITRSTDHLNSFTAYMKIRGAAVCDFVSRTNRTGAAMDLLDNR